MAKESYHGPLERVDATCWRIPKSYKPGMRVDGLIFASERLLSQIKGDQAPEQVANVASLPGIQHASLAMPDIHWGYGFCIGGVCATDPEEGGVISPGGVGYDINCGVRLVRSNLYLSRREAASCARWSRRCSATCRPASAARADTSSTERSCTASLARGRVTCRAATWRRAATSNTPRPRAGSTAPTRTASPTTPSTAGRTSAARSAPATTSSKCRSSIRSSTRRRRRCSASKRTWCA